MAEPTFDLNKRWSEACPEPVPTEPCISPTYFALERERVPDERFFHHFDKAD